jgi:serine/threonine protein kinase
VSIVGALRPQRPRSAPWARFASYRRLSARSNDQVCRRASHAGARLPRLSGAAVGVRHAVLVTSRLGVGNQVGGYTLIRRLDAGGQGEVWEAHAGDGVVALKVSKPLGRDSSDARLRFQRELKAANTLQSAFVARPVDWDSSAVPSWIAYERVVGVALKVRLQREDVQLPLRAALDVLSDVSAGLVAIHELGWAHCDLKPANIMVGPRNSATILDLGAVAFGRNGELTQLGMGTDNWRSPEQVLGGRITPASDVFALGLLIVKTVTGHLAYSGTYPFGSTPDLRGLPFGLTALTLDCLATDAAARPTATSALERLRHWRDELRKDQDAFDAWSRGESFLGDWPLEWSYLTQLQALDYDVNADGRLRQHATFTTTPMLQQTFQHAPFYPFAHERAGGVSAAQRGLAAAVPGLAQGRDSQDHHHRHRNFSGFRLHRGLRVVGSHAAAATRQCRAARPELVPALRGCAPARRSRGALPQPYALPAAGGQRPDGPSPEVGRGQPETHARAVVRGDRAGPGCVGGGGCCRNGRAGRRCRRCTGADVRGRGTACGGSAQPGRGRGCDRRRAPDRGRVAVPGAEVEADW